MDLSRAAGERLAAAVRQQAPLVQCITNFVSMDLMANTLLAIRASPAMVSDLNEVADFVRVAAALLINVGTLSGAWVQAMHAAVEGALAAGKPWVLDPVACGATPYRTQVCTELVAKQPTVVRGNASEILALAGAAGGGRGVDSTAGSHSALEAARQLARRYRTVVAVTGEADLVTDGERVSQGTGGNAMITAVTASGCSVTAVIAAYVAAAPEDPLVAAAHALATFRQATGYAARQAAGPASLRTALIDELYARRRPDSTPYELSWLSE